MPDLLIQAMSAKQIGDLKLAKQLLSQAIVQNPRDEGAWMLMAEVVEDAKLQRNCFERVLAINPNNATANAALAKLDTAPLEMVIKGERNKPAETPTEPRKAEKIPPFTPPFTWDGQPEQYLALGDLTFPTTPEEETPEIPETPPTFDWTNESSEPDKTIDKIFDAVSNQEMASEAPPQKESNWLDNLRPSDEVIETPGIGKVPEAKKTMGQKVEDPWLNELVGSDEATVTEPHTLTEDDFSVSAEPQLGLEAFAPDEKPSTSTAEPDSLLWDNPQAKTDRLVILSYRSLIYANPQESDIPHIMGLFNENRMVRDLLGEKAHMIKLESIERVSTNPQTTKMVIEYKSDDKIISHELTFSSPQVRDEAFTALKYRLGAAFIQSGHTISLEDKILTPIVIIVLVAILSWILLGGIPLLSRARGFDTGAAQAFLSSMQQLIYQFSIIIIVVAVLICAACGVWMALNLRKPSSEVVLKR